MEIPVTNTTPKERAQKFLDRQPVLPSSLPDDDPIRIIWDLLNCDWRGPSPT